MEKYFSTFDVAKLCHVSPASVTRWITEGKLKASRTIGGHKRVNAADLVKLLQVLNMPIPDDIPVSCDLITSKSILVVDDDEGVRKMICNFLRNEFQDYAIEEAKDGFAAGWIVQQKHPELIILDLRLPGVDGFSVCSMIRKSPEFNGTRIIATTGYGDDCREAILELGADEFIAKPFDWNKLKQAILRLKQV